jgi:F-type H+-transporting ATPase subunit b
MTIDWWTLGIQTVNVAILIWLLQRFFWRPVAAIIADRRGSIQHAMAEAAALRDKAAADLAEVEQTRAGFAKERDAILAAARDAAEKSRAASLAEAATAVASVEAAAKAAIERDRQAAEQVWARRSGSLAIDIAGRLATRLDGACVRAAFLDWLLKEIATLPDEERQAAVANGAALEAFSATPLDAAEQERCRGQIGQAFGGNPGVVFKTDPTLIAGLELRGPHLLVSNSWRSDLAQILADLTHEK